MVHRVHVLADLVNCAMLAHVCELLLWKLKRLEREVVLVMETCGQGDFEIRDF